MPGLAGYSDRKGRLGTEPLERMRGLLRHFSWYRDEALHDGGGFFATRTHLGAGGGEAQPATGAGGRRAWLEGEIHNRDELAPAADRPAGDAALLLGLCREGWSALARVDGTFCAVIVDSPETGGRIHLVADRHGLKPLYWALLDGELAWSSEMKGFLGHPSFRAELDREAVHDWQAHGHLLENRSWFRGVSMVPPGTVLSWDPAHGSVGRTVYRSPERPAALDVDVDEAGVVSELARLFRRAVARRVGTGERLGLLLSGGLDSRAILAAMPGECPPPASFTFGQAGCDDRRIARGVARLARTRHHEIELHGGNWLAPRVAGVWISDGGFSLLHMHGVEAAELYRKQADVLLNGFLGDATLGGLYIDLDPRLGEAGLLRNRGRRFINQAVTLIESRVTCRRPFYDNELLERVYALPDGLRAGSKLYNRMLLECFPRYFERIPWQKTGRPLGGGRLLNGVTALGRRVADKLRWEMKKSGRTVRNLRGYAEYDNWIREERTMSLFRERLLARDALYPEYLDRDAVRDELQAHERGPDSGAEALCRTLTFELWLQQVFEGRFRDAAELGVQGRG